METFRLEKGRALTIKEMALSLFRPVRLGRGEVLEALCDINLTLRRGECVGLIGPNGAGKSTLLAVIAGILRPTKGRVVCRSQPAIMLDAGAGMRAELSGVENMRLYASLLKVGRRELYPVLGKAVEFADLSHFVSSPIRTYSHGMLARLGVALLLHLPRDILLLDEVLGPGDIEFRDRCTSRIRELVKEGKGIMLVSHDMEVIRQACDRVIWLDKGRIKAEGTPEEVVPQYESSTVAEGAKVGEGT